MVDAESGPEDDACWTLLLLLLVEEWATRLFNGTPCALAVVVLVLAVRDEGVYRCRAADAGATTGSWDVGSLSMIQIRADMMRPA
jgi:hypothetical protein